MRYNEWRVNKFDTPSVAMTNKCIILDLDQTLIATQDSTQDLAKLGIITNPKLLSLRRRTYYFNLEELERRGDGTSYGYWGITRPHLTEFLIFCFSYFKTVAVWSAGQKPYVEAIVDHIFKDIRPPHIVWTANDIEWGIDRRVKKPLSKMIKILNNPFDIENVLALDDNPSTFSENIDNGILIPEYSPACTLDGLSRDDPTLLQLKAWLLQPHVMTSADVRLLEKDNIFSTPLHNYNTEVVANFK